MLKHLKKVVVQFMPGDPKAISAREFLQRVTADTAKRSNPQCKVDFLITEEGQPGKSCVELTFADNEQRKVFTADHSVQDLTKIIDLKGGEMEMKAVLKEVGYDPWKPENRLRQAELQPAQQK